MKPRIAWFARRSYTMMPPWGFSFRSLALPPLFENLERAFHLLFQTFSLSLILVAFILLSIPPTSFVLPFCRSRWRLAKHIIYDNVGMWLTVYSEILIRSTREGLKVFRKYNCVYLLPEFSFSLIKTTSKKKQGKKWRKDGNARYKRKWQYKYYNHRR